MLQQFHKEEKLSTLESTKLEAVRELDPPPLVHSPHNCRLQISDDFESLPFLFMNFHGGSDLNEVLALFLHSLPLPRLL
jgi:hypothetical protein